MGSNQNVARGEGEHGPSWWDVSEYCAHMRARWGLTCVLQLVPPIPVGVNNRWSSWGCRVQVWRGEKAPEGVGERVEHWGTGGTWKTAPAAAHAALRQLETRLLDRERAQRAQAAF